MRWFLSLAATLMCAFACHAQDVELATAKAKAALALSSIKRGAAVSSYAKDKASAALKKRQEAREPICFDDLGVAIALANKAGRPLFVWVGMTCTEQPEIRVAFQDAVHAHTMILNGKPEPRLLVRPIGADVATPFLRRTLSPASIPAIKAVLTPGRVSAEIEVYPATQLRRRTIVTSAEC